MGSDTQNTINPVLRDTVAVGNAPTDNVVIRFRVRPSSVRHLIRTDRLDVDR